MAGDTELALQNSGIVEVDHDQFVVTNVVADRHPPALVGLALVVWTALPTE